MLQAGWAMRKPPWSEAKEGRGEAGRPSGMDSSVSSPNTGRKGELGRGLPLYLGPHHDVKVQQVGLTTPRRAGG